MSDDKVEISFLTGNEELPSLHTDERFAILATCILSQQSAGFRNVVDLREAKCEDCGASGFNSGWGYWLYACGAEVLTDGELGEPCPRKPTPPMSGERG